MGFRTTMTTEDLRGIKLPKWFRDKWQDQYSFGESKGYASHKDTMLISSKHESKFYNAPDEDIFLDIQKVMVKKDIDKFIVVMLHECGGITRVQIEKDKIRMSEPTKWKEVEQVEHDYCYGCSDLKSADSNPDTE